MKSLEATSNKVKHPAVGSNVCSETERSCVFVQIKKNLKENNHDTQTF